MIVETSSSNSLKTMILQPAGRRVTAAYKTERKNHPDSAIISLPSGHLAANRIYIVKWQPNRNLAALRTTYMDLIATVTQQAATDGFTSIALPLIGGSEPSYSVNVLVKLLLVSIQAQLAVRHAPPLMKLIVPTEQGHVYEMAYEWMSALLARANALHSNFGLHVPLTWECGVDEQRSFVLDATSQEYNDVLSKFNHNMVDHYRDIVRIERIQNERCYLQFVAHRQDLRDQLKVDTETHLFHGCPEAASKAIIEHGFNRNYAGAHGLLHLLSVSLALIRVVACLGTLYGFGVYFSTDATYSHRFSQVNSAQERRMFLSRVLIGRACAGNASMKKPLDGYHSSTDGHHIFVTYHDAQALAEYLIVYR